MTNPILFFCAPPDDECINMAKDWLAKRELTSEYVRLYKDSKGVYVSLEKPLTQEQMEAMK